MGPRHTVRLLLVIEFFVDLGPGPPQLFTGAALQCLLKSLKASGTYPSQKQATGLLRLSFMSYRQRQGMACPMFNFVSFCGCVFCVFACTCMRSGQAKERTPPPPHPVVRLILVLEPNRPKEAVSELPIIPATALLCPLPSPVPCFTPSSSVSFLYQSADRGMAPSQTPPGRLSLTD